MSDPFDDILGGRRGSDRGPDPKPRRTLSSRGEPAWWEGWPFFHEMASWLTDAYERGCDTLLIRDGELAGVWLLHLCRSDIDRDTTHPDHSTHLINGPALRWLLDVWPDDLAESEDARETRGWLLERPE